MNWLLSTLTAVVFVELLLRLPIRACLQLLLQNANKAQRILRAVHVSDHRKEKVLLHYAGQIFVNTIAAFVYLLLCFAPLGLLFGLGMVVTVAAQAIGFMASAQGLLFCTLIAIVYSGVRRHVFS